MKYSKTCTVCGVLFRSQLYNAKYCGEACRRRETSRKQRVALQTRYAPEEISLYGYKEPLRKFEGGYGYYGVLTYSKDRARVQCHVCGGWFKAISDSHLKMHDLDTVKYKEKTGLLRSSALVGEETRMRLIRNYKQLGIKPPNISKEQREKNRLSLIERNRQRRGEKVPLEAKNKRGNCPDQLLDKITTLANKLGHVPSRKEFYREHGSRFIGTIYATFGSWKNAIKRAGMKPISITKKEKYSDSNLLGYLYDFYALYGYSPRTSDMKRGLLPSPDIYIDRFGSLNTARKLAGVPLVVSIGNGQFIERMADN